MPDLPTFRLDCAGQADPNVHAGLVAQRIGAVLDEVRLVVVQGDTSSALGGVLGAALTNIPVAHVEAGLRTHDRLNPWPEEDFRIAIDRMADLLFAPTELNAANLRREGTPGSIFVTGNTGIDALLDLPRPRSTEGVDGKGRLLVTCHRRESWGQGLTAIASCLTAIGARSDVAITFVLHPNPRVAAEMVRLLGRSPNLELRPPCSHGQMLRLMCESDLILSDSGGMQEEAPALGIPLLILRDRTERPEGIASGSAILVGRDPARISTTVERLLDDRYTLDAMRTPALPYGDGRASLRIADEIARWLSCNQPSVRPIEPRSPSLRSETIRAAR